MAVQVVPAVAVAGALAEEWQARAAAVDAVARPAVVVPSRSVDAAALPAAVAPSPWADVAAFQAVHPAEQVRSPLEEEARARAAPQLRRTPRERCPRRQPPHQDAGRSRRPLRRCHGLRRCRAHRRAPRVDRPANRRSGRGVPRARPLPAYRHRPAAPQFPSRSHPQRREAVRRQQRRALAPRPPRARVDRASAAMPRRATAGRGSRMRCRVTAAPA